MAILYSAFESYLPFIVGFTGQLLESIVLILALSSGVGIGWKRSACGLVISQISADSKRFGNEMTSAQEIAGNRFQLGRESNAFRTRCREAVGLLKFPALREIHTSVCRNKKKTGLWVKKRGAFRGITIAPCKDAMNSKTIHQLCVGISFIVLFSSASAAYEE